MSGCSSPSYPPTSSHLSVLSSSQSTRHESGQTCSVRKRMNECHHAVPFAWVLLHLENIFIINVHLRVPLSSEAFPASFLCPLWLREGKLSIFPSARSSVHTSIVESTMAHVVFLCVAVFIQKASILRFETMT